MTQATNLSKAINAHLEPISSQSPTPAIHFISLIHVSFFANSLLTPCFYSLAPRRLNSSPLPVSCAYCIVCFSCRSPILDACSCHRACSGLIVFLLPPAPVHPRQPWSHFAMDFVTGLPLSKGNVVILAIVDWFSKAAHFIAL